MAETPSDLFTSMLRQAGVPVTAQDMQREWDAINTAQGSRITNDSAWSPFWRLISSMVTAPAQWLVSLLVEHALPNTFLRYASGQWLDVFAWGVSWGRSLAPSPCCARKTPAPETKSLLRPKPSGCAGGKVAT